MKTLEYGHMDNMYIREEMVDFSRLDPYGNLKLQSLFEILSNLATEDYTMKGMSYNFLIEHGYAFLLHSMSVRCENTVCEGEKIICKTWGVGIKGAFALRGYEILKEDESMVASGIAQWVLVNPKNRMLYRPKDFEFLPDQWNDKKIYAKDIEKLKEIEEVLGTSEQRVAFNDLDLNGHTTNSVYGAYVINGLPQEYQKKKIQDIQIDFVKEAFLGERILISYGTYGEGILVTGKKEDGTLCFRCRLIFQNL